MGIDKTMKLSKDSNIIYFFRDNNVWLIPSKKRYYLILLSCLTTASMAQAVLTAMTVNTIQGTAPYLTFDNGTTKTTDTDGFLSIKLSDGAVYIPVANSAFPDATVNTSTASTAIELPVDGQTMADIEMLVPTTANSIALSDLITVNSYWNDDDGDGQGTNGITSTGILSLSITDASNNSIGRSDTLDRCSSPYKVVLTATTGTLSTQYGAPNSNNLNAASATYYIQPKNIPYTCFAKPNLISNYGTQPEWDGSKGFKLQDLDMPSSNFPRTGFNKAFFDITIMNASAQSVINTMGASVSPQSGSGVTLSLTALSTNVLRVTLNGPSDGTNGGVFTPSIFKLKTGTTEIYSFEISKWFIARSTAVDNYSAALAYCSTLTGEYRVPSVSEYTNANGNTWAGGLPGQGNTYARAIGNGKQKTAVAGDDSKGGLFAEWGVTTSKYYLDSDFDFIYYWTVEPYETNQYMVLSGPGRVLYYARSDDRFKSMCVMP